MQQLGLFASASVMPEGFTYRPEVLSRALEQELIARMATLDFAPFQFHGYTGKRRIVSYGWKYDFEANIARRVDDIPAFLHPVRDLAAQVADMEPQRLQQALVTEYEAGSAIGWHRDKAVYGQVVGVSLRSECTFRLRRRRGDTWERASRIAEPRSIYVLDGPARNEWEHSVPAVPSLRYSITFRNLKGQL